MKRFWVTGGLYTDTSFKTLASGQSLQKHGPFNDYEDARKKWNSLAWANVDDCQAYFTIKTEIAPDEPEFWVVGGTYASTEFKNLQQEQQSGPFKSYDDAKKEWQRLAWDTVDDANARFRIETVAVGDTDEPKASSEKLAYRVLTGPDDKSFCERVSAALADGYELHGSPSLTAKGDQIIVAQALVLAT